MSFDFSKYESFARALKESSNEEDLRNSASRGYYSFYHKVKTFFQHSSSEYIPHKELISELLNDERLKKGPMLSRLMQGLKEDREQADYHAVPKNAIKFDKKYLERFWYRYDMTIDLLSKENLED
jgi:uncharacterized protein (UPF0332 family)